MIFNFYRRIIKKRKIVKSEISNFLKRHFNYSVNRRTIIVWELGGFPQILVKNAIISLALNLRGFKTHFVICDGAPIACIKRGLENGDDINEWNSTCGACLKEMLKKAEEYSLEYSLLQEYISKQELIDFDKLANDSKIEDIININYRGIRVGELAWSSFNRFMKGNLVNLSKITCKHEVIYRKYLFACLVNTNAACNVFKKYNPRSVLTSHGVYTDYAPSVFLAYQNNIKTVSWASGYSDFLHYFYIPKAANKMKLRSVGDDDWKIRKNKSLSDEEVGVLKKYIENRYFNNNIRDINLSSRPESKITLKQKLGFIDKKPIVCLFAHINWDACFDISTMVFDNANTWVIESIKAMMKNDNVNWLIRAHPGELTDGSLYTTDNLIKDTFKQLPSNIKILWNDSDINSYGLYELIDSGITIFGTVGVELPLFGKPVIVAGDAHFSNKGFTLDAKTKEEYFSLLESAHLIKHLNNEQIEHAQKYAYLYFIQRQVPINVINKSQGHWGDIDVELLDKLLPGNDYPMDCICDGIIDGKDVILDKCEQY